MDLKKNQDKEKRDMKSEKGMALPKLLVFLVVMTLFLGVATYVVVQDNGVYDREIKPLLEKTNTVNEVSSKK